MRIKINSIKINWLDDGDLMQGCTASAEVSYEISDGRNHRRLERLTSGGLWGIESDSDAEYKIEIASEQLDELKEHLAAFNIDLTNFDDLATEAMKK